DEETGDRSASEVREILHFDIVEGPKGTITEILFRRATEKVAEADLRAAMNSKIGGPYLLINAKRRDEDNLKAAYADRGFPSAQPTVSVGPSPTDIVLTVDITEGQQIFVGDIRVVGFHRTHEADILKALTLKVGGPFGEADRRQSEQNIARVGL